MIDTVTDFEWGDKLKHRETCCVCGGVSSRSRTVFRCELCGRPVCSQCLSGRSDGFYCQACVDDPALEMALEDVGCPKCRGTLGGFLVDDDAGGLVCEACGHRVPLPGLDNAGWDRLVEAVKGGAA